MCSNTNFTLGRKKLFSIQHVIIYKLKIQIHFLFVEKRGTEKSEEEMFGTDRMQHVFGRKKPAVSGAEAALIIT